jgi:hypothetical protein
MASTGAEDNDIACVELEQTALLSSEADFGDAPRAIPTASWIREWKCR